MWISRILIINLGTTAAVKDVNPLTIAISITVSEGKIILYYYMHNNYLMLNLQWLLLIGWQIHSSLFTEILMVLVALTGCNYLSVKKNLKSLQDSIYDMLKYQPN